MAERDGRASQGVDRDEWMRRLGPLYPAIVALGLLTRAPVLRGAELTPEDLARSAPWFPVIGGLVGGVLALVAHLLLRTELVPAIAALVVVAMAIAATGALHEGGLARTAELLGSGADEEMPGRDAPGLGFYGLLAVLSLVAVRGVLLLGTASGRWVAVLVASQIAMRWSVLLLLRIGDRLAEPAPGERTLAVGTVSWATFGVASAFSLVAVVLFGGGIGVLALGASALVAFLVGLFLQRRYGGLTSSTLGAASLACELAVLICFAAAFPPIASPWAS